MTYSERIRELFFSLEKHYDRAGSLRDAATGWEKEHFNEVRGKLREVISSLRQLDDNLGDRGDMELGGEPGIG
jgi:hypothetical protein